MRLNSHSAVLAGMLLVSISACGDADKPTPQATASPAVSEASVDASSIDRAAVADGLAAKAGEVDVQKAVRDFILTASDEDLAAFLGGKKEVSLDRPGDKGLR
jgi:hypothetical protein